VEPIPPFYFDTIAAGFGDEADLYTDVLRVSPDAPNIELRIAYFKRGREIMKEAGPSFSSADTENLPELVRTRFQAVSMAYEIVSNPAWKEQYLQLGLASSSTEAPSKPVVRFKDQVEERVFQPEPWEKEYSRMRRERRRKKILLDFDADRIDAGNQSSLWNDLKWEMGDFEQSLGGFFKVLPENTIKGKGEQSLCAPQEESHDARSDHIETRSMPSWLSPSSFQPLPSDHWNDTSSGLDNDTSYASSFNPFAEDPPKRAMQSSPTSLLQELAETTQVTKAFHNRNNLFAEPSKTGQSRPLSRSPEGVGATQVTRKYLQEKEEHRRVSPTPEPVKGDQVTEIYQYPTTNSRGPDPNKKQQPHRVSISVGPMEKQQKFPKTQQDEEKQNRVAPPFSEAVPKNQGLSKNPFVDDPQHDAAEENQVAKTSYHDNDDIFEGLDDLWDNKKIDVSSRLAEGFSVISEMSESIVVKMMIEQDISINPFDNSIVSSSPFEDDCSSSSEQSFAAAPEQQIPEEEQAGFAASLAASVAAMVADCQRTGTALQTLFGDEDRQVDEVIRALGIEMEKPCELPIPVTTTMAEF
jgi:curved DNA-binding protein CbpA